MTLLAPLLGVFGLAVPAIIVLYVLRVRRRDVVVSSTLLWVERTADRQASVPWQRLRPSWLLLLQLLAAASLVIALIRPALAQAAPLGPDTVVVLDASGPMQSTDVRPSRFAVAVEQARHLVDQLSAGQRMTLVAMDAHPRILASTGDPGTLRSSLDALRPSAGLADLRTALALAASAPGPASQRQAIVLSDGVVDAAGPPVALPFAVQYRPIGATGENVGISAISASSSAGRTTVAVSVTDHGRQRHRVVVETRADGRLVDAHPVELEPGGSREVDVGIPATAATVMATLTPHDAFRLDDVAALVVHQARRVHAVLVTAHNVFLAQALRLRGDIALDIEPPASYRAASGVDLWIFDGFLPSPLPLQPYWIVGPPAGPAIGAGEELRPGLLSPAGVGDPLLAGVDLSTVAVAQTRDLRASSFGRAVITSAAGPVLLVGDGTPRRALLGFDLHDSDLPLTAAFPVLVDRLSNFLAPQAAPPRPREPDGAVVIPVPAGSTATVTRPDGTTQTLQVPAQGGDAVDADTDQVGLYSVVERSGTGTTDVVRFAVDALDAQRSMIAPRAQLPLLSSAPVRAPVPPRGTALTDLWPWLAGLALLLLTAEWLVFHRGS